MDVILDVPITSEFSKYNGNTFEVFSHDSKTLIGIIINGEVVNFSYKEIIIKDVEKLYTRFVKEYEIEKWIRASAKKTYDIEFTENFIRYKKIPVQIIN